MNQKDLTVIWIARASTLSVSPCPFRKEKLLNRVQIFPPHVLFAPCTLPSLPVWRPLSPFSIVGVKHIVSGKKLDASKLRKAIKTAMLVDWYNKGIISFRIATEKGMMIRKRILLIKLMKNIDESDFSFEIEKRFITETGLKEKKEVTLYFNINKMLEERWFYILVDVMNTELAERGYLCEINGGYMPVREKIEPLKKEAIVLRRKMDEFKQSHKETYDLLYKIV